MAPPAPHLDRRDRPDQRHRRRHRRRQGPDQAPAQAVGVPVPEGRRQRAEAWEVAQDIGLPVVEQYVALFCRASFSCVLLVPPVLPRSRTCAWCSWHCWQILCSCRYWPSSSSWSFPLDQSLQIGLAVLATAAGAPFLPKLVQGAKGNVAFGVGLMVLLMVVTIIYMPLVLPLLLQGVFGESVGHRLVADCADARTAGHWLALQIALARHRRPLAAGDGQDFQPGHPRSARGGTRAERLQYHQPDWHGRPPGAAALHRRVAADRSGAGWTTIRAPAA